MIGLFGFNIGCFSTFQIDEISLESRSPWREGIDSRIHDKLEKVKKKDHERQFPSKLAFFLIIFNAPRSDMFPIAGLTNFIKWPSTEAGIEDFEVNATYQVDLGLILETVEFEEDEHAIANLCNESKYLPSVQKRSPFLEVTCPDDSMRVLWLFAYSSLGILLHLDISELKCWLEKCQLQPTPFACPSCSWSS
jgi:hypothetical protein